MVILITNQMTYNKYYINYITQFKIGGLIHKIPTSLLAKLSQISYSLVVILELSSVLEIQYKEIMISSINKNN